MTEDCRQTFKKRDKVWLIPGDYAETSVIRELAERAGRAAKINVDGDFRTRDAMICAMSPLFERIIQHVEHEAFQAGRASAPAPEVTEEMFEAAQYAYLENTAERACSEGLRAALQAALNGRG